ncbi:protein TIC 55 chloroplastic [Tripterygium wilfordii]|uniref:Protein TIC 55 chloroplastic n=1 Tax=Tripterygium wilfordii TaxID=458696 RepID=A0A7J7BXD6_TRIWF|nr:protein TIC 55, chloroplastic-like [Tripterygium wilfordii]KAF5726287.1 protein TIC 55 chloroplastic [Tripterygium wilfordii]
MALSRHAILSYSTTALSLSKPQPFYPLMALSLSKPTSPLVLAKSLIHMKPNSTFCLAVADMRSNSNTVVEEEGEDDEKVFVGPATKEEESVVADYDWTEEWYPLYLTKDVPDDAPLGLTVFDKQIVLYKDANGELQCFQDRCPHRLAKLSEGQLINGRLECLYHGWQFESSGMCVKIPQLPSNAKIPRSACAKTYEVRDSQGVVWVWMSRKTPPNGNKLPWIENFSRPGFQDDSGIHELPYDHSILLENLMDPAHVPISHDRTDFAARRKDAQPLRFEVSERTNRGFSGWWGKEKDQSLRTFLRFEAPCVLQHNTELVDEKGEKQYFTALFLCRPTGQGKSMIIVRFGATKRPAISKLIPKWYIHQNACKIFEEDMGFLSSQNEILIKEKVPTKELYLNLKSSDVWVAEYRKWMDKVGHGMPYHFGHRTISLPEVPAAIEHAPAGHVAGISASFPAKGGIGTMHSLNFTNRYFRHVIHCKGCRSIVKAFTAWKNGFSAAALTLAALAILASQRQWKAFFLISATFCLAGVYACSTAIAMNTENFIRMHRRL